MFTSYSLLEMEKSMIPTETAKTRLLDLVRKVGPLDIVYDCGSRDALDGLELAIAIGAKELHIFECNPPAVEICRKNVIRHKPEGLTVFINDCAIADKPGPVSFSPSTPAGPSPRTRMATRAHPACSRPIPNTPMKHMCKARSP